MIWSMTERNSLYNSGKEQFLLIPYYYNGLEKLQISFKIGGVWKNGLKCVRAETLGMSVK